MLFYSAIIKAHIEYCCVIRGNTFNSNLHKLLLKGSACKLILGTDYILLEDYRRQLNMLPFEELVFMNKATVMFNATQGIFEFISQKFSNYRLL